MFIYLAQPIDQRKLSHTELGRMVSETESMADMQGHTLFKPGSAYQMGYGSAGFPQPREMQIIDSINRHAVAGADGVVAILPAGVPTLGVPAEIELALKLGKPVHIVASPSLITHSVQIGNWQERGVSVSGPGEQIEFSHALRLAAGPRKLIDVSSFNGPEFLPGATIGPVDLPVRYDPAANPMTRAYPTDAGFDLATLENVRLQRGVRTSLRTGVHAPPPDGWWGLLKARSSTGPKYRITVHEAVIDAGYQGELMVAVTLDHTGLSHFDVDAGTRLAQYILLPAFPGKLQEVFEFAPTSRGTNGYGSSGA